MSKVRVEVHLYASFKNYLPEKGAGNSCILEVEEGATIEKVLSQLNIPPQMPKVIFRNGIHAAENEILKDGDRLGAFPPVAGG